MLNLDQLIASAHDIAPLPESVRRLVELLSDQDVRLEDVEDVFSYDGALSAKLLRQANSVVGGGRNTIGTVSAAVVRLGFDNVLAMAVSACTQDALQSPIAQYGMHGGDLLRHSQGARLAVDGLRKFAEIKVPPEAATTALLHDIGKVVLAQHLDAETIQLLHRASRGERIDVSAEREILGVHHGELGGLIAQNWQLPEQVALGIIYHHDPENCTEIDNRICHITCAADWLSRVAYNTTIGVTTRDEAPQSLNWLGVGDDRTAAVVQYVVEGLSNLVHG